MEKSDHQPPYITKLAVDDPDIQPVYRLAIPNEGVEMDLWPLLTQIDEKSMDLLIEAIREVPQ